MKNAQGLHRCITQSDEAKTNIIQTVRLGIIINIAIGFVNLA
jgi:hypothetical protein